MKLIQAIVLLNLSIISVQSGELNLVRNLINDLSNLYQDHQIIFIRDIDVAERQFTDELFKIMSENYLVLSKNLNSHYLTEALRDELKKFSSIFFIYLFSPSARGVLPSEETIEQLKRVSYIKNSAKYLLINYAHHKNDYLPETLKMAWKRQMLDFTILEIIDKRMNKIRENPVLLIHSYNPFLNNFTKTNYSPQTKLFPNTLQNLHGYPLKIGLLNIPPFLKIRENSASEGFSKSGANYDCIKTLSESMNFTPTYIIQSPETFKNFIPQKVIAPMTAGTLDIYAHLFPAIGNGKILELRAEPIDIHEFSAVVPVIENRKLPISLGSMSGYLLALIIVMVFWCLERFTHLDSHYWNPFVVVSLLFGVTVVKGPRHSGDRIMFASLVIVSMMYSSNLYSSMMHGMVNDAESEEFDSFEELDESGLVPMIHPIFYNKTFQNARGTLLKLKRKVKLVKNILICLEFLQKHKNVSCLMSRTVYMAVRQSFEQDSMKLMRPYFWKDSVAFLLSQGSPYRERVKKLITVAKEIGLTKKWYYGLYGKMYHVPQQEGEEKSLQINSKDLITMCLAILLGGYILASIVFLGELIHHFKFGGKCSDTDSPNQVMFYLQEKPLHYEGCKVGLCDWEYLKNKLGDTVNQCSVDRCLGSGASTHKILMIIITMLSSSLILLK